MNKGLLVIAALLWASGCESSPSASPASSAKPGSSSAPATTAASTTGDVDCEKVVEKIASLNPPDARGEPEKKLWRAMCAEMKPPQKSCVMGAKTMDEMKGCMK